MKNLLQTIIWCIAGSIAGAIGMGLFMNFRLFMFGQNVTSWLGGHNMPRLAIWYSFAQLFWLDWLVNAALAVIAAFLVRRGLLLKMLGFSALYVASPWLLVGPPTARGHGLAILVLFSASVPVLAVSVAWFTRSRRMSRTPRGFAVTRPA